MTASCVTVRVVVDVADGDETASVLAAEGLELPAPDRHRERRTGGQLIGPVLEYVLPGVASLAVAVRVAISLVRGLAVGVVIDCASDQQIRITRDRSLPRGVLVVRRDSQTLDVVDLADNTGLVDKVTALLQKKEG